MRPDVLARHPRGGGGWGGGGTGRKLDWRRLIDRSRQPSTGALCCRAPRCFGFVYIRPDRSRRSGVGRRERNERLAARIAPGPTAQRRICFGTIFSPPASI